MNYETLDKANDLSRKIKGLHEALSCFSFKSEDKEVSLNPKLIIEYDHIDGPEQHKIPMQLSQSLIETLRNQIELEIVIAESEFNSL